jgi:hypothetical protein
MAPMAWEAVRNFAGLSPEAWKAIGEQEETHELQHQLAQAVLVRMRLNCLNGARHRRRLRHFLHDWAPLQPMCDACDEALQALPYAYIHMHMHICDACDEALQARHATTHARAASPCTTGCPP